MSELHTDRREDAHIQRLRRALSGHEEFREASKAVEAALDRLELAILKLLAEEASVNLLERSCLPDEEHAPNTRLIVTRALTSRLGPILEPYLRDSSPYSTDREAADIDLDWLSMFRVDLLENIDPSLLE